MLMDVEEKKKSFESYIDENIGQYNFETVFLFMRNARYLYLSLQLQIILLKRLDYTDERKIDLASQYTNQDITIIKQITMLGVISKIENLIESFLIFIHSLSDGYKKVNSNMTYYSFRLLDTIIKKVKGKSICYYQILGYCEVDKLGLSSLEQKTVRDVYEASKDGVHLRLLEIVKFYEQFKYIHEKFKHGLNIVPGLWIEHEDITPNNFEKSILLSYTKKINPKNEYFYFATTDDADPNYNILSRICFTERLEQLIFKTIRELDELINYICSNHIIKSINCGETYLPFDILDFLKQNDKQTSDKRKCVTVKFLGFTQQSPNFQIIQSQMSPIITKIVNEMNYALPELRYNNQFKNLCLKDIFEPIINVFFQENLVSKTNS